MANISSPPSPASSSSELSKFGLNPSSPLYLYQLEQLKMLQRNSAMPDLSLLYQNPTIFYTANPFWWQQLIFSSLPPVFNNNHSKGDEKKPDSPVIKNEMPHTRDYILTPETPEREDTFDIDMDEPLNLSKKDMMSRDTDISSSLPPTPKLNTNLFSAIWSPASLVSQNEKSFGGGGGVKCESVENSPTTPKMKFNFDNLRELALKREASSASSSVDYELLKKNCTDMFLLNNNNNSLSYNNNNILNSSFSGSDSSNILDKVPKMSRKSLPIIKPDSTEHSDYLVRETRDERGRKERSFEVRNRVNLIIT
jgi:hypothetical protein